MKRRDASQTNVTGIFLHIRFDGQQQPSSNMNWASNSITDGFLGDRIGLDISVAEPCTFVFQITEQ